MASYFTIVPWGYAFNGIVMVTPAILNVYYKPFTAAGLAVLQLFILYIPMAYWLSGNFGIEGIFLANPISYVITTGIGLWLIKSILFPKRRLTKHNF